MVLCRRRGYLCVVQCIRVRARGRAVSQILLLPKTTTYCYCYSSANRKLLNHYGGGGVKNQLLRAMRRVEERKKKIGRTSFVFPFYTHELLPPTRKRLYFIYAVDDTLFLPRTPQFVYGRRTTDSSISKIVPARSGTRSRATPLLPFILFPILKTTRTNYVY